MAPLRTLARLGRMFLQFSPRVIRSPQHSNNPTTHVARSPHVERESIGVCLPPSLFFWFYFFTFTLFFGTMSVDFSKVRVICFDVDSTVCPEDGLDALGQYMGKAKIIADM